MAENSKIEWCDHTVNLWWGCTPVHEGCDNCYAEVLSNRWKKAKWGNDHPRVEINNWENHLMKYQRQAEKENKTFRIFINSMSDIFERPMPVVNSKGESFSELYMGTEDACTTDRIRRRLFNYVMPLTPNLIYLLLTKRPSNINKYIPGMWRAFPPKNVIFGTSVVNQETADKLIPQLLMVNGKKFLSIEPQLDRVDLHSMYIECDLCNGSKSVPVDGGGKPCEKCIEPYQGVVPGIDWVIVGGESGPKRRPYNKDWARSLRDECKRARVPFFMKQIDKVIPVPETLMIREFPKI